MPISFRLMQWLDRLSVCTECRPSAWASQVSIYLDSCRCNSSSQQGHSNQLSKEFCFL
ncbi:hypothetical protein Leryth_025463, partial [Lithospermum erythrorhizon]